MSRAMLTTLTLLASTASHAFTVGTIATTGCHERLTLAASREAGVVANPAGVTPADRALRESLTFPVEGAWDRETLALLIGVRDNDFHGVAASDFSRLAEVHFAPALQQEYCLRSPSADRASGDFEAMAACREFILGELRLAAQAEPGATEEVVVALTSQTLAVQVPSAQLHLGRALHAVQDGFTHMLRDEGFTRVRSVFNYIEPLVGSGYLAPRDGHAHLSEYDSCESGIALERAQAAQAVSREIIAAVNQHDLGAAEATLDRVWGYEPACADGEAWCAKADELLLASLPPTQGCSSTSGSPLWALALVGLLLIRPSRRVALHGAVVGLLLLSAGARAEEQVRRRHGVPMGAPLRLSLAASVGVSAERGGAVVSLGLRLPLTARIELCGELEFNPWFDLLAGKLSAGVLNAVVGASVRWAMVGAVELRSSLGVGASMLLHDTVGAQAGSLGPFLQLSVINVVLPGPGSSRFEVRPDAVLSVPSLRGIPLVYPQYRLIVSLRLD